MKNLFEKLFQHNKVNTIRDLEAALEFVTFVSMKKNTKHCRDRYSR